MPNYRYLILYQALCLSGLKAAPLQPEDIFHFGTFKSPRFITGGYRRVYIANRRTVLIYDQIKNNWEQSVQSDSDIRAVFYSSERQKFRIKTSAGHLEFNETFRDWTPVDSLRFTVRDSNIKETEDVRRLKKLPALSMPHPWDFLPGSVRDRHMRQAIIREAAVISYDRLWVLTDGSGFFKGSLRKRRLEPAWLGLDDPDVRALLIHKGVLWIGSARASGALTSTGLDFKNWKKWRAGYSTSFPNGVIHDIAFWRGYYWLATEDGVIRYSQEQDSFLRFGYFQGLRSDRGLCLLAGENALMAGTERGTALLTQPDGEFQFNSHPNIQVLRVTGLAEGRDGNWLATQYGLYQFRKGKWTQPGKLHLTQGLKIKDVAATDSAVFWIDQDRLMTMAPDSSIREVLVRTGLKKVDIYGDFLFGTYSTGLVAYSLENALWSDYHLNDGITGTVVNTAFMGPKYIWVATDRGISRLNGKRFLP